MTKEELNQALKDWGDEIIDANKDTGELATIAWVVAVSGTGGAHGRFLNIIGIYFDKDEATRKSANLRRTSEYRNARRRHDVLIHIRPLYADKD